MPIWSQWFGKFPSTRKFVSIARLLEFLSLTTISLGSLGLTSSLHLDGDRPLSRLFDWDRWLWDLSKLSALAKVSSLASGDFIEIS
jgi:hypothetical protein